MKYLVGQRRLPLLGERATRPCLGTDALELPPRAPGMVVTVVREALRETLDTGVDRPGVLVHVPTVQEAAMLMCEPGVSALVISPDALQSTDHHTLASLATRWSMVRVVALIDDDEPADPAKLVQLGSSGSREIIDLRQSAGWRRLRSLVEDSQDDHTRQLVAVVAEVLTDANPNARWFFTHLVRVASETRTVRKLASEVGLVPSTLMSRFFRAKLPSPKCFLATTRLVLVRKMLDVPSMTIAAAAYRLQFSSPQSLGRTIRQFLGVTAGQFRSLHSYEQVLGHYLSNLFVPFRGTLKAFDPFGVGSPPTIPGRSGDARRMIH